MIKFLEENIVVNLPDFELGFLRITPKAQATKEKIGKLNTIKAKTFVHFKGYHQESGKNNP